MVQKEQEITFAAEGYPPGGRYQWRVSGTNGVDYELLYNTKMTDKSITLRFLTTGLDREADVSYTTSNGVPVKSQRIDNNRLVSDKAVFDVVKVEIEVQKRTLTLKHDCESNLEVKVTPNGVNVEEYKIMIRRENNSVWYTLSTNQKEEPWRFVIAGKFKLKGMVKINGTEISSNKKDEKLAEVRFPTYTQIVGDSDVQSYITAEWTNTLNDCTQNPNTRRERGFWIRINTISDSYEHTGVVTASWVGPTQGASINLGSRPADDPIDPAPNATGAAYSVASFHTHTPTAYRLVGRAIGPSPADHTADTSDDVAGIVYDYTESPAGSGSIPAGHPEDSAANRYHSGPNRRTTP